MADHADDDDTPDHTKDVIVLNRLEEICVHLRRNHLEALIIPEHCRGNDVGPFAYTDSAALMLAGSLMGNTSLKELCLMLDDASLSEIGIRALALAIFRSRLETLRITEGVRHPDDAPPSEAIQSFYVDMITSPHSSSLQEVRVELALGNQHVQRLGQAFSQRLSGTNVYLHWPLKHLSLNLESVSRQSSVRDFCKGLEAASSNLTTMELAGVSTKTCRYLVKEGILTLYRLRHLNIGNEWYEKDELDEINKETLTYVDEPFPFPPFTPRLQSLTLSYCGLDDNDLQLILRDIRGHPNLTRLSLEENSIGNKGIQFLAESWKEDLSTSKSPWPSWQLKELNLKQNLIGADGLFQLLEALQTYPSLKTVFLWDNPNIGKDMGKVLEQGQQRLYSVRLDTLGLAGCQLQVLPKGLFRNSSIEFLDLGCNNLEDGVGVVEWLNLNSNNRFKMINLSLNYVEVVGMRQVIQASCGCPHLTELDMSSSEMDDISFQDLVGIAQDLTHSKLVWLELNACESQLVPLKDEEETAIAKEQIEAGCHALVNAIQSNMYLQRLTLTGLPKMVDDQVGFYLKLNRFGRRTLLQNDDFQQPSLWSHVFAKCRNDASIRFYLLREKQPVLFPSGAAKRRGGADLTPSPDFGKRHMEIKV